MTSPDYYRLALQQQMLYHLQMEAILKAEEEIEALKTNITAKHKKHRRCDKEIQKEFQVKKVLFSVKCVRKSMLLT